MEEGKKVENEVKASGEDMDKKFSYVLHGGKAYCPYGNRTSHLQVPLDHGTFIHDMPIMDVFDCQAQTNIQSFGICSCTDNPDRAAKIKEIKKNVKKSGGFMDKVMSFFCGKSEEKDTGEDLEKNVTIQCIPKFAVLDEWEEGTDKLRIKGIKALNSGCKVLCLKGDSKALIQIADDGQKNAEKEKQSLCDFDNWKEGDPMPDPSQRNVQNLDKNISDLEDKLKNCKDPSERAKLENEISSKKGLQKKMTETKNLNDEIDRKRESCPHYKDPDASISKMEKDGSLKKMMDDGSLMDKDGNKPKNVAEAKKMMKDQMKQSNDYYDKLNSSQKDLNNNYKKGYSQDKVDKIKSDIEG